MKPDHLPSLTVYMTGIVYSLVLALYVLLINRRTRIGTAQVSESAG